MLTDPNAVGLFDKNILEITKIVHDAGGLCYYDGANLNALMGVARHGDIGEAGRVVGVGDPDAGRATLQGTHPQLLPWTDDTTIEYERLGKHSHYGRLPNARRELRPSARPEIDEADIDEGAILEGMVAGLGGAFLQEERAPVAEPLPGARVGRYVLRPEALTLAVQALDAAMHEGCLVIIDEIGPFQLTSPAFRDAVLRCLDGPCDLLATVAQSQDPFVELLKARPGVRVMEVTWQNRAHLADGLQGWISGQHRI